MSTSIEQEDACHARIKEERKKRILLGPTRGAPPKYHLVYTPPSGNHVVTLGLSCRATVHLSRWPHALQSTRSKLLHLELHNLLGQVSCASTTGVLGISVKSIPNLVRATLLGPHHYLAVSRRQ
jgi:hypothetical protein